MSSSTIEKSIQAAAASLEMEGFSVDPRCVELCRLLLTDKISMEEYLARVTSDDFCQGGYYPQMVETH